ncbi:MAG: lysylphosphatidylglycerol synthase transmembrane domain-containing protein [Chitinophagaceae bacterium]
MKKNILSIFQYLLFLGIGIFLVWWSVSKIEKDDWVEIRAAIQNADYWLVAPVVIILLISHYSRALRWKILMQPLGYKPSIINTFLAVLVGYLANLAIPRLGEVLKCSILARYEKVPVDKLVGTIVAERAFDLVCLIIVFAITILLQIDIIGSFAGDMLGNLLKSKTGSFTPWRIVIGLAILIMLFLLVRFIFRRYAHVAFIIKIKSLFKGIWQGIVSVKDVKQKGWFFFHTALIWVCYLYSIRIGFLAMQQTEPYGVKEAFSVLSMGSVGMIATQGGIGAYPVLVQETMMLYGISENIGKAFGWLLWLLQFFMVLVFGFISLGLLPVLNRKKNTHEKSGLHTT